MAAAPPSAAWKDTTDGIHAFLTFDSKVDPSLAAPYAGKIDYVWGSTESKDIMVACVKESQRRALKIHSVHARPGAYKVYFSERRLARTLGKDDAT